MFKNRKQVRESSDFGNSNLFRNSIFGFRISLKEVNFLLLPGRGTRFEQIPDLLL
jgi:hypothetical protein